MRSTQIGRFDGKALYQNGAYSHKGPLKKEVPFYTYMRLSHWFGSLLVGIGLGFREVQFSSNFILNCEFPDPPN